LSYDRAVALPRETKIGRYELLIELGRGGMAELFLGRLHGAGGFAKLVAIKRILPHLAQDKQFTELFLNEGQIAARLSHPNVCQVFELDDDNGSLYLAMEYLDGVSWDVLSKAAPQAKVLGLTAGVLAQAAEGLHYAHTLHDLEGKATAIVHRDVSPQNLFVTVDGLCKVLDFGVAKLMTDGPRTRSGVVKGKLPYMAPEQIRGEPVDARTDVVSLGVCAWEALANERLFDRATDFLIWKAVTEEDAPTIASRWPQCPPAVDAAVRRALDREAANRFPSARAFADALRAAVPDALGPTDIADVMRSACGDQIAARAQRVATAVSTRRSLPFADPAAVEPPPRWNPTPHRPLPPRSPPPPPSTSPALPPRPPTTRPSCTPHPTTPPTFASATTRSSSAAPTAPTSCPHAAAPASSSARSPRSP
jgi:eukaryotic-like serine/threonine-protein kinase